MTGHKGIDLGSLLNRGISLSDVANLFINSTILGRDRTLVAIPDRPFGELEANIRAALLATNMNLASLDYAKKRYVQGKRRDAESRDHQSDEQAEIKKLINLATRFVAEALEKIDWDNQKTDYFGQWVGAGAIKRLQTSFLGAGVCFRLGFGFEGCMILRMILEQLAWVYEIRRLDDDTLFKVRPSKSISQLKHFVPLVGRLYGFLSEKSHLEPEVTKEYLHVDDEGGSVLLASLVVCRELVPLLLVLADVYDIVFECLAYELLDDCQAVERAKDGSLVLLPDRPVLMAIRDYPS